MVSLLFDTQSHAISQPECQWLSKSDDLNHLRRAWLGAVFLNLQLWHSTTEASKATLHTSFFSTITIFIVNQRWLKVINLSIVVVVVVVMDSLHDIVDATDERWGTWCHLPNRGQGSNNAHQVKAKDPVLVSAHLIRHEGGVVVTV